METPSHIEWMCLFTNNNRVEGDYNQKGKMVIQYSHLVNGIHVG